MELELLRIAYIMQKEDETMPKELKQIGRETANCEKI